MLTWADLYATLLLPWVSRGYASSQNNLINFTSCSDFWQLEVQSTLQAPEVSPAVGRKEGLVRGQVSSLCNS